MPVTSRPPERAHPRSRGENVHARHIQAARAGSSPLTRGKLVSVDAGVSGVGLIPAHAGKTPSRTPKKWPPGAHPRSRGENDESRPAKFSVDGSSPLTRGKPEELQAWFEESRLIPAHAGKTTASPPASRTPAAHPRSRGENLSVVVQLPNSAGSSPLTRGKRFEGLAVDGRAGLIPAHAGKTASLKWRSLPTAAHPRSRGENRFHDRCRGHADWLIPAHAGKTAGGPAAWRA